MWYFRSMSFLILYCFLFLQGVASTSKIYIAKLTGNSLLEEKRLNPSIASERAYKEDLVKKHDAIIATLSDGGSSVKKIYSYANVFNGFSVSLNDQQYDLLRENPEVDWVTESRTFYSTTTQTPKFLGLTDVPNPVWSKYTARDIVIGVVDTGIFPESPSFNDSGLGKAPKKFKGICQAPLWGPSFQCNNKIIGARYFVRGYYSYLGRLPEGEYFSARDISSHGTHVASTVAGSKVYSVKYGNVNYGTASGVAINARIAVYKALWGSDMTGDESDIIAALEAGVEDGVDLFTLSLGSPSYPLYLDALAFSALQVISVGIPMVFAAGNRGKGTVSNDSPWVLTVAASSFGRYARNQIMLGNNMKFQGAGAFSGSTLKDRFYPLVNAASAAASGYSKELAELCVRNSLNSRVVRGKIVLCKNGKIEGLLKSRNVFLAGAAGMILYDQKDETSLTSILYNVATSHVNKSTGLAIANYIAKSRSPIAKILDAKPYLNLSSTTQIASFSSTGPDIYLPRLIKPDITAPGVNILAAITNYSSNIPSPGGAYDFFSGTSMATPHVSGVVALIKSAHPEWKPSWIYSAIITSGNKFDNLGGIKDHNGFAATPFQMGGGHIDVRAALAPGLVYNMNPEGYRAFYCTESGGYYQGVLPCSKLLREIDFNFPYLSLPKFSGTVSVTRKLTLVGSPATYSARVEQPAGAQVSVRPTMLNFTRVGQTLSYRITVKAMGSNFKANVPYDNWFGYTFGTIKWIGGPIQVNFNVAVSML